MSIFFSLQFPRQVRLYPLKLVINRLLQTERQKKKTNLRTTLGFRQEEFIQNGEMKVTLKEQNADHSGPASVRRPKEIWKYKTLRYVGFVAKRKNRLITTGDSKR